MSFLFGWLVGFGFFPEGFPLCSPGCPRTHSVDQAGIKLRDPCSSCLPSAGIKGLCHYAQQYLAI